VIGARLTYGLPYHWATMRVHATDGHVRYTSKRAGTMTAIGVEAGEIALSRRSVEFFKDEARRHNTQYQRMIRRLLDAYAELRSRRRVGRPVRARAKAQRGGG
jgi:hypothetical protein